MELTPELKAEMLAKAQVAEGANTLEEDLEDARIAAEQVSANLQARAYAEEKEPEKVAPGPMSHAPSASPRQGVDEWGPYDDYEIVTTRHGQFGVPKGQVLHFEPDKQFFRRDGQWRDVFLPRYRDALPTEKVN